MGFIYKISIEGSSKVYIGQTGTKLSDRWKAHKYWANKYIKAKTDSKVAESLPDTCSALYPAMAKYGLDKCKIEVVEECDDPNKLNELEIKYITQFNSVANGYNLKGGGKEYQNHSDKTKQLISENTKVGLSKVYDKLRVHQDLLEGLPQYCGIETMQYGTYYCIRRHPLCKRKLFKIDNTEDDKIVEATKQKVLDYFKELEANKDTIKILPVGIRKVKDGGYKIQKIIEGNKINEYFSDKSKTDDDNYALALNRLNELTIKKSGLGPTPASNH